MDELTEKQQKAKDFFEKSMAIHQAVHAEETQPFETIPNANFTILCKNAKISAGTTRNEICIEVTGGFLWDSHIMHFLETIDSNYLIETLENRDEIKKSIIMAKQEKQEKEKQEVKRLNLYEKIQAVSLDVNNISKSMTVGSGNYSYKAVGDLQVTLAVKKSEAEFKIISIPIKQEIIKSEIIRGEKDGRITLMFIDDIKMTVRFYDLEDVTQFLDIESFGRGVDNGDKGFGKASTYARKYALLNAYKIATGEDPDATHSEDLLNNLLGKESKKLEPTPKTEAVKEVDLSKVDTIEKLQQVWASLTPEQQADRTIIQQINIKKNEINPK